MYLSITLILKHLNVPTCFDLYSDHLQGARSFLVKATEFKITKNIKGQLWQCGSVRLYGVLCGDASWTPTCISTQNAIHTHQTYAATLP